MHGTGLSRIRMSSLGSSYQSSRSTTLLDAFPVPLTLSISATSRGTIRLTPFTYFARMETERDEIDGEATQADDESVSTSKKISSGTTIVT